MNHPLILFVLAIMLPPLSVWSSTRDYRAVSVSVLLCLLIWLPAIVHALMLSNRHVYRQRSK